MDAERAKREMSWWPMIAGGAVFAAAVIGGGAVLSRSRRHSPAHSEAEATVACPPEDLYRYWRNFENLPHFMVEVESVAEMGGQSHWEVGAAEWDSEIIDESEPDFIHWRSVAGSAVSSEGLVQFVRIGGGTLVRLSLDGLTVGDAAAHLRRFKLLMETGA